MTTKPTVFILGAGASYGFGYPLGKNLVEIILKNFDPDNSDNAIKLFTGLGFSGYALSIILRYCPPSNRWKFSLFFFHSHFTNSFTHTHTNSKQGLSVCVC